MRCVIETAKRPRHPMQLYPVITNDEESRICQEDEVAVVCAEAVAAWAVHAAVHAAAQREGVDVARCVGDGDAA